MPTQAKAAVIDEITERFQNSSAAVLTEYRGLTVAQLTELRRSLGEGSSYAVVKNTLTKRAADAVGFSDLGPLLNGPTAIAFIQGDPVNATATFETLPTGLTHVASSELVVPSKNVKVQVQNFNYNKSN